MAQRQGLAQPSRQADSDDDDFYEEAEVAGDKIEGEETAEKRDCVNQQDP